MNIKSRINSRRLLFQYIYMGLSDIANHGPENIAYLKTDIYAENNITVFDDEYINLLTESFDKNHDIYIANLTKLVNEHTTGFGRDDMDNIKKTAFMLGYIESQVIKTPKLVVINEVIELCKLFGNDQAAKLVNGIIHKILLEGEGNITK